MKKLLIPALLAALIVGCSSTPIDETAGAPVESRSGSGVTPVTAGGTTVCGAGGCFFKYTGSGVFQGDITAGVFFGF